MRTLLKSIRITLVCLLILNQYNIAFAVSNKINIMVDNQILNLKQPPITVQGLNLVPLRDISERIGAKIKWDESDKRIYIYKDDKTIKLQLGSKVAYINDKKSIIDIAPQLNDDGTLMVPLRFISEVFGLSVKWSSTTNTIMISSKGNSSTYYQNKVIFLTYHGIDPHEFGITISPEHFKQQLDALNNYKYNIISMSDYLSFVNEGKPIPPNAVVLTFDDGYESFYTYVYPELKKRNLTATNFVVIKSSDHALKGHMTWDEMRTMKKDGMSFYNHTYNLHFYGKTGPGKEDAVLANRLYQDNLKRTESEEEYKTRIRTDLQLAEKRLKEELGQQESLLCFPYGFYNKTVIQVANELGINRFFTVNEGIADAAQKVNYRIHAGASYISAEKMIETMQKYND